MLSIGDFARVAGISPRTLRHYGELGLLLPARVDETSGYRYYELAQLAAHLDALERGDEVRSIDTIVKTSEPLRVAHITIAVQAYGFEHINPVFELHLPRLWEALVNSGVEPGIGVAYYEEPKGTDDILVHVGYDVGSQAVPHVSGVTTVELPATEVASTVHRGSMREVMDLFEALVRWIETSGFRINGWPRELYRHWATPDESHQVTEFQIPITTA